MVIVAKLLDIPGCVCASVYVGVTHSAFAALGALLWIMSTKPFIIYSLPY